MIKALLFFVFCFPVYANFDKWKNQYANRAARKGLNKTFVLKVLKDVKVNKEVIKKDQNQVILDPDRDFQAFMKKWLKSDPSRIDEGKAKIKEHEKLLSQIEARYGVEKEVIVALWGTETLYGQITGDYDIIESLATLSYEGRRRRFFETQLNAAIRLLQQGHVEREKLKGSWAGATGHCQFMPSNIPLYAQDYDGDGKKDIWGNHGDIFASIANYLKKNGWQKGKSIGALAYPSKKRKLRLSKYRTQAEYNRLGFRDMNGEKIKGNWSRRKMAEIPLKNSPYILRGSNYKALRRWNRSNLFAAFNIILINGYMNE